MHWYQGGNVKYALTFPPAPPVSVPGDNHGFNIYSSINNDDLTGWYDIPTNEEIEEWSFDSICFTPGEDEVEPDHPDSWLRILGLI